MGIWLYVNVCIGGFIAESTVLVASPQTEESEKCTLFFRQQFALYRRFDICHLIDGVVFGVLKQDGEWGKSDVAVIFISLN